MSHAINKNRMFLAVWLAALLLAALIYLPGLPGDFVFDDIGTIVGNSKLTLQRLDFDGLLHAALSAPAGGFSRPLSMLSFALDAYFFGISPLAFKATNILIHLGCGVVFWFLSRELLRTYARTARKPHLTPDAIAWLSLVIMALWLVHPLNLTPVLYTVQRDTSLAALFTGAAILSYMTGRRRQLESREGRWHIWILTPLFTVLGFLCKENAALVPVYIAAIEWTLLRFRAANGRWSRDGLLFLGLFLILPILAAGVLLLSKGAATYLPYSGRDFTLYQRLLSECRFLLDYLRWMVIPDIRELALFHDDMPASTGLLQPTVTLPCVVLVLALLAAALALHKRAPLLSLGLLWFFAGQLMESTILPLELVFEHRNYVPLFGVVFASVTCLYLLALDHGSLRPARALAAAVIILFAGITAVRASDWHSELSYARAEVSHHPQSPRALSELGWAYIAYIIATGDRSLVPQVIDAEERSKAADGAGINQDMGLAFMFSEMHDLVQEKAYLDAAANDAQTAHTSTTAQAAMQSLLVMGVPANQSLYPDMATVFQSALANPKLNLDSCYSANTWNTYALFSEQTGSFLSALGMLHKAVALCPRNPRIRANFAQMLLLYGDTKDASEQIEALRALHDIHFIWELRNLENDWRRQTGQPPAN